MFDGNITVSEFFAFCWPSYTTPLKALSNQKFREFRYVILLLMLLDFCLIQFDYMLNLYYVMRYVILGALCQVKGIAWLVQMPNCIMKSALVENEILHDFVEVLKHQYMGDGTVQEGFISGFDRHYLWDNRMGKSELAKNPRVMSKVQTEIRKVIGNKNQVEESEIEKLKYFKMVVKETLRLHPAAPLLLPRESMQYCKIGGYSVYPKTRIFVNAWAIGGDSNAWLNPEEFYPERFEDSEIDFKGQHYELIPFGAVRRICPGMTMGLASVESIPANMLHCFDWQLPRGMKPEDINMEEVVGLTVNKKFPLELLPIRRIN